MSFIIKTFPKFIFLFVGALIVILSFFSANTVFSQGDSLQLAQKKMYLPSGAQVKKEILPDHVLYPVFMVFDRVRIVTSSEKEQVDLHVSYSWQRLDATKELLQKGYQALSFTTFTKACKHQNLGLLQAEEFSSDEEKQKILVQSKQFYNQALSLSRSFSDVQQIEIIQLLQEQKNLQQIYSN